MRATLAVVVVLASPAAAFADGITGTSGTATRADPDAGARNELTVGPSTRALRSASADALTDNSLDGGSVTYAREVLSPIRHLSLWADAGIGWGEVTGTMFQTVSTDVNTFDLRVGARARYQLHPLLAVAAHVDVGTQRESLTLDPGSGQQLADARWGSLLAAGVTADVYAISYPRFGLGLRFDLGYVKASAVALRPAAGNSDDTIQLPMADASFGHLDLSGPTFSGSIVGRF